MRAVPRHAVFMVTGLLLACGSSDFEKRANETVAMSQLKKFQTANALYHVEFGHYVSLETLYEDGSSGAIDDVLFAASDSRPDPQPINGYLFSSLDEDDEERVGLCAYPQEPGETGDLMICALTDLSTLDEPEESEGFVSGADEWRIYVTDFTSFGGPLRTWPSDEQLDTQFTALEGRSPKDALTEARRLMEETRGE